MTKEQRNQYMKSWIKKNPEKIKEHDKKAYKKFKQRYIDNAAKWRSNNPKKYKLYHDKFMRKNPNIDRKYRLKYRYGLTLEQFNNLLLQQKGLCYICRKPSKKVLNIDHNHKTGKVRSLLCQRCNIAVGFLEKDNLLKAINVYLKKFH